MSMSRVQELIDERRSDLPVGLARELLDACREEADLLAARLLEKETEPRTDLGRRELLKPAI